LSSDYFYEEEVRAVRARHETGQTIMIPVISRPCPWQPEFGDLQVLPKDGKPLTKWQDIDEAYTNMVEGVELNIKAICTHRETEQERIRKEKEAVEEEKQRKAEEERLIEAGEVAEVIEVVPAAGYHSHGRNILRRPNLSSIVKENGLIVVYVCADKYGRVIKAQAVKSQSTIKNVNILFLAAKKVKSEMRFSSGEKTDCMYYKVRIGGVD